VLTFIARPVAAWICLWPFRFTPREINFTGWVGLRGAVPIILATIPVMARVNHAIEIFNIVFFIVVFNALIPGTTLGWVARRFKLGNAEPPAPAAVLEILATQQMEGEVLSFLIDKTLAVCGVPLSAVRFPQDVAVILIVRGRQMLAGRGFTVLEPGDHVYVWCQPENRPYVELLFGRPEEG
jgi:potassium/hydrogen antiporter